MTSNTISSETEESLEKEKDRERDPTGRTARDIARSVFRKQQVKLGEPRLISLMDKGTDTDKITMAVRAMSDKPVVSERNLKANERTQLKMKAAMIKQNSSMSRP
jgi:hypothetical protein